MAAGSGGWQRIPCKSSGSHFSKAGPGIRQGSRTFTNCIRSLWISLLFLPMPGRSTCFCLFVFVFFLKHFSPLPMPWALGNLQRVPILVQVLITSSWERTYSFLGWLKCSASVTRGIVGQGVEWRCGFEETFSSGWGTKTHLELMCQFWSRPTPRVSELGGNQRVGSNFLQ